MPAAGAGFSDALAAHQDRLLACVHCGFCLPACPTYVRLGDEADSPRGRLHLMRALVEGRLEPSSPALRTHLDRCLGCRACETACPSGVEYGSLLELARGETARARRQPLPTRLLLRAFASRRWTRFLMMFAWLLRVSGAAGLGVRLIPALGPLRQARLALAMVASSGPWHHFHRVRPGGGTSPAVFGPTDPSAPKVGLLEGCVQKWLFARVNDASERVLEVNGFRVVPVPGQGCCGALHLHGGDLDTARTLARHNVDAFTRSQVAWVAVNAAGCGSAMKEYGSLLAGDPQYAEPARALAARVRDVSEILAEAGPRPGGAVSTTAAWDPPCHLLHAQRVERAPWDVLAAIPELDMKPLEGAEECCGGAGIYGLTQPGLGGRIGRDKARAVARSGAGVVVTGNPGCAMQMGAWLRMEGSAVRVVHLVELLDESYRSAGHYRLGVDPLTVEAPPASPGG